MTEDAAFQLRGAVAYRGRVYLIDRQLDSDGAARTADAIVETEMKFTQRIRVALEDQGARIRTIKGSTKLSQASNGPEGIRGPRIRLPDIEFDTDAEKDLAMRVHVNVCRGTTHSKIIVRICAGSGNRYTGEQARNFFQYCTELAKPVYEATAAVYRSTLSRCVGVERMEGAVQLDLSGIESTHPAMSDLLRDLQHGVIDLKQASELDKYGHCVDTLSTVSGMVVEELVQRAPVNTEQLNSTIRKWHVRRGRAAGLYVGRIDNDQVFLVGLCVGAVPAGHESIEPSVSATMALVGEITARL